MPDVQWNLKRWGETHDWSRMGDEWSDGVGGPAGQWYWWMYPRIHAFLPAARVLEIAPGFGRWTQFLLEHTRERFIGIDIAKRCVDGVLERFKDRTDIEAHVNDGYTFPMVADHSIDFVFSFGSLIHAERDVMESYVPEIARVLRKDGVAFVHHSNAAANAERYVDPPRNHALSVSGDLVADLATKAGLIPAVTEIFNWDTPIDEPISCLSLLFAPESRFARAPYRFANDRNNADADYAEDMSRIYP